MSHSPALRERSLDLADLTIPRPLRLPIDPSWIFPTSRLSPALAPRGPRVPSLSSQSGAVRCDQPSGDTSRSRAHPTIRANRRTGAGQSAPRPPDQETP